MPRKDLLDYFQESGDEEFSSQEQELLDLLGDFYDAGVTENPDSSIRDLAVSLGVLAFAAGRSLQADQDDETVYIPVKTSLVAKLFEHLIFDNTPDSN